MRDRQPTGNIGQREVFEATCSSAQIPSNAVVVNNITPQPAGINTPVFYPAQPSPAGSKTKDVFCQPHTTETLLF